MVANKERGSSGNLSIHTTHKADLMVEKSDYYDCEYTFVNLYTGIMLSF